MSEREITFQLNKIVRDSYYDDMHAKDAEVGGFEGGHFVRSVTFDESNKWVRYYRKDPAKYAESTSNSRVDKPND